MSSWKRERVLDITKAVSNVGRVEGHNIQQEGYQRGRGWEGEELAMHMVSGGERGWRGC